MIKTSLENEFKIQITNLDNQISKLRAELHAREINESIRNGLKFCDYVVTSGLLNPSGKMYNYDVHDQSIKDYQNKLTN